MAEWPTSSATPSPSVTATRVQGAARAACDADIRDCTECGKPIGLDEPFCFWSDAKPEFAGFCAGCVAAELTERARRAHLRGESWIYGDPDVAGFDPFANWVERDCAGCGRPMRTPRRGPSACSADCDTPAARIRERRRQMRESEIPESFTCKQCERVIEGAVVIVATGTWCEPCYIADRERVARKFLEPGAPVRGFFGDPDKPHWSPWPSWMDEPAGCLHCGRSIRGAKTCCARCDYEAEKAARRVERQQKACAWCGEAFTPKRKDARTCSDSHRQALSRWERGKSKTPPPVTDNGDAVSARTWPTATNRDSNGDGS
jgi:hypothetical protein